MSASTDSGANKRPPPPKVADVLEGRRAVSVRHSIGSHVLIDFDDGSLATIKACSWLLERDGIVVETDDTVENSDIVQAHMQGERIETATVADDGMEIELRFGNGAIFVLSGRNDYRNGDELMTVLRSIEAEPVRRQALDLRAPIRELRWTPVDAPVNYERQNPFHPPVMTASEFAGIRRTLGLDKAAMGRCWVCPMKAPSKTTRAPGRHRQSPSFASCRPMLPGTGPRTGRARENSAVG